MKTLLYTSKKGNLYFNGSWIYLSKKEQKCNLNIGRVYIPSEEVLIDNLIKKFNKSTILMLLSGYNPKDVVIPKDENNLLILENGTLWSSSEDQIKRKSMFV